MPPLTLGKAEPDTPSATVRARVVKDRRAIARKLSQNAKQGDRDVDGLPNLHLPPTGTSP
jgi:hypothetical protein